VVVQVWDRSQLIHSVLKYGSSLIRRWGGAIASQTFCGIECFPPGYDCCQDGSTFAWCPPDLTCHPCPTGLTCYAANIFYTGTAYPTFAVPFTCCGDNDCSRILAMPNGYPSVPSTESSIRTPCPSTTVLSNTLQPTTPPSGSTKSSISLGPPTQPSAMPTTSGLSTGAKAGIDVGSAVAALVIAASLGSIRRRRRNRKKIAEGRQRCARGAGDCADVSYFGGTWDI